MSSYCIEPLDGYGHAKSVNIALIETMETYEYRPHKLVPRKMNWFQRVFLSELFYQDLVPDGEPFQAMRLTMGSGQTIHAKFSHGFYDAWLAYHRR